ncbi:hypothetical protein IWW37_001386 [Coemansia sp. RSA 2050]|nr:hypothetical protein IWW37_001386 [Coemansia sp. RSA 2050]KAJ2734937.1 hypothetical protein IW152_001918 [Coemansia sp. BCRC 34962]
MALRLISQKHDLHYSVWWTHEHEFYDMKADPYQLTNKYSTADRKLLDRLDALVAVLQGRGMQVSLALDDALDAKHDALYSTAKIPLQKL